VMSLSGIAIAIGTMVDMGIVVCENVLRSLKDPRAGESALVTVHRAVSEVGGAVLTAIGTTVVSFLPVFTMGGAGGKLFKPLAFTKTFALLASVLVALFVIPALAHLLFPDRRLSRPGRVALAVSGLAGGIWIGLRLWWALGLVVVLYSLYHVAAPWLPQTVRRNTPRVGNALAVLLIGFALTRAWLPIGPDKGLLRNLVFVLVVIGGLLIGLRLFMRVFEPLLRFFLRHKLTFAVVPALLLVAGACSWLGFGRLAGFLPEPLRASRAWNALDRAFPGLGREFMPPLDEGSFLLMPTTMPHASIGEALDQLRKMDMAVSAIPEVDSVVGKLGRAETALDPAPVSMFETVINYKTEYRRDPANGRRILDDHGRPIRQWREHIRSADDIWSEIVEAARIPGVTAAPRLQPIAARTVMLQSGMRAPMGVKIKGRSLEELERVGLEIEQILKHAPGIDAETVVADRIVGKPYLEIEIDRESIGRYGMSVRDVQDVIEIAIGGKTITRTVEGRERYPVRVRYMRELRDSIESLERILVPSPNGSQVPIGQIARVRYARGPQVIRGEDTFLVGFVTFDKKPGLAEVDVVRQAERLLREHLDSGDLRLPPGTSYSFAGTYENQLRSQRTLGIVLPAALAIIFLILFLQFRSVWSTGLVFSGILVAWAGGFVLLWLYGQPWFLDFELFGVGMRDLFQVRPINLSVAVWVGFLALFGIASDNGVVLATYLDQSLRGRTFPSVAEVREATVEAALRRLRPCLMTAGTTILALLPVLTSTGRGSDVMAPMAIPSFGGMLVVLVSVFVVPVGYAAVAERRVARAEV